MSSSKELREFVAAAKNAGASDEALVGLLQGRGWPKDDAYRALGDHYESRSGLRVPVYKRSGSARDAFLYLFSFAALGTWTIGLGSLMFTLIDHWIRDPLTTSYGYGSLQDQIAGSLASLIVAFPIYLLVMFYILRRVEVHADKLESPVRKWLTYIALLIAAGVVLGDLIAFLTHFLQGELTGRFVAKDAVVFIIAGGVFWYYMGAVQKKGIPVEGSA
ncbi:MAG TPA: DUF5671 domain-containing protein [Candidatus Acidoferrales bacterium]|nr:DUF5671 domain-containing protein [Candidatus Acidoferrales bacterium]